MNDTSTINPQVIGLLDETLLSSPAVIYRVDASPPYRMEYLSANVESLLDVEGKTLKQESGWDELVHPEDLEASFAKFVELLSNPSMLELHRNYRLRTRAGHFIWVSDRSKKAFRENQLVSIVGSVVSVDQQFHQQQMIDSLMQAVPGMLYQFKIDTAGKASFPFVSQNITEIYGISPDLARENADVIFDVIHPDDKQHLIESIEQSKQEMSLWSYDYRVMIRGRTEWLRGQAMPTRLEDGSVLWHGQIMVVTSEKETEEALAKSQLQLREAQRIAKLGHWVAYPNQNRLEWSDNVFDILNIDRGTFTPTIEDFLAMIHRDDIGVEQAAMKQAWETGNYDVRHRVCSPSGDTLWVHERGELTTLPCGQVQLLGTVRDITAEKQHEESLRVLASTDALTGVANRRCFNQALEVAFSNYSAAQTKFSVILFDYDLFKSVNDSYGHSVGDEVLKVGAQIIQQAVRNDDLFARLGGEEFAVILYGADTSSALTIAEKLREKLKLMAIDVQGQSSVLNITASFGVVEMSSCYQKPDDLLNAVDQALYQAKGNGRDQIIKVPIS